MTRPQLQTETQISSCRRGHKLGEASKRVGTPRKPETTHSHHPVLEGRSPLSQNMLDASDCLTSSGATVASHTSGSSTLAGGLVWDQGFVGRNENCFSFLFYNM